MLLEEIIFPQLLFCFCSSFIEIGHFPFVRSVSKPGEDINKNPLCAHRNNHEVLNKIYIRLRTKAVKNEQRDSFIL